MRLQIGRLAGRLPMASRSITTFAVVALLSHAGLFSDDAALSQPGRTIKVIISVPPGGAIDALVRILADQIGKTHGPTFVIENRPGAGSVIAAEAGARATPDGNTLLINNNGMVINAALRKQNYHPLNSYEPICYLVSSPQVLVVNSSSPYGTLAEIVAAARAKPG